MSKEAMKLALEALDGWRKGFPDHWGDIDEYAVDAIREALAEQHEMTNIERHERNVQKFLAEQPSQQEPFGYFRYDLRLDAWVQNRAGLTGTPFYTSPPPQRTWVGLTDEEILAVARDHYNPHQRPEISFARAIEAKLKEENT